MTSFGCDDKKRCRLLDEFNCRLECIMALQKSSDKGLHFASALAEWNFLLNNLCILLTLKMKC